MKLWETPSSEYKMNRQNSSIPKEVTELLQKSPKEFKEFFIELNKVANKAKLFENGYISTDTEDYKALVRSFEPLKRKYSIYFMWENAEEPMSTRQKKECKANIEKFEINRFPHIFTWSVWPYTNVTLILNWKEVNDRPFRSGIDILNIIRFEEKSSITDPITEKTNDHIKKAIS